VTEAPTMFGPVSYRIESTDSKTTSIHIAPPTRTTPRAVRIHLRHPEGRKIADVKGSNGAEFEIDGDAIRLLKPTEPVDLIVTFAPSQ
jgi:hypothetical protein